MNPEDIVATIKAANESGIPVEDLSKNVLEKPTKELGEGLGNLFWLAFSPIHVARASLEPRINQYKKRIEEKLAKIPPDNLIEPPLNIVGPTLEAAKYHIEDENLQEMFANLIASAMDSEKIHSVHPAFVEIIKQLSPFDAKCLQQIIRHYDQWPIAKIQIGMYEDTKVSRYFQDKQEMEFLTKSMELVSHVMPFDDLSIDTVFLYSAAINNITRLSLIDVDYTRSFTNQNRYEMFERYTILDEFGEHYQDEMSGPGNERIEFKPGLWSFTEFGKLFVITCLPEDLH